MQNKCLLSRTVCTVQTSVYRQSQKRILNPQPFCCRRRTTSLHGVVSSGYHYRHIHLCSQFYQSSGIAGERSIQKSILRFSSFDLLRYSVLTPSTLSNHLTQRRAVPVPPCQLCLSLRLLLATNALLQQCSASMLHYYGHSF